MWWALIEEITPRAEEMAGEKEIACCVRGYHVYKDILWAVAIREVLVCSMELTNIGKIFIVKLYLRKIFSYVFCVRKYFYNENKANYVFRPHKTVEYQQVYMTHITWTKITYTKANNNTQTSSLHPKFPSRAGFIQSTLPPCLLKKR